MLAKLILSGVHSHFARSSSSLTRVGRNFQSTAWAAAALLAGMWSGPIVAADPSCANPHSESLRKLVTVVEYIQSRHADTNVAEKLVAKVIEDLQKQADPHARYYDVDAYRELRKDLAGILPKQTSVSHRVLPGARGYLKIQAFDESVPTAVMKAIDAMQHDTPGGLSGLVLDVRDNPGGLVRTAVAMAAMFLSPNELIVTTRGSGLESKQELRARPDDYLMEFEDDYLEGSPKLLKSLPLTVLVNRGSASASEILAGALQDHGRARVIGTRTYGKGTVQTIIPLQDETAIKFTTSYFHTPKGRRVDGEGLTPDVVILRAPKKEAAAEGLLAPASVSTAKRPAACVFPAQVADTEQAQIDLLAGRDREDCQLQQALLLLAAGEHH